MFSYYGSKGKVVDCYPPPKFNKIIEPFAGSARYSLKYWENDILLIDKFHKIIAIWHYLQQASEKDILGLPILTYKQSLNDFDLSKEEKWFLGYFVCGGGARPKLIAQKFNCLDYESLKQIASNLHKIRHWHIKLGDYIDLQNEKATWFIDPPYQYGGIEYSCNKIDFPNLANWCKERNGQVIVCENTKANWLPFNPMKDMQGIKHKTTEAIWSNLPTNYDHVQQTIF